ncbi:hypothetical protein Vi05172_g11638 [Venturia inaequalis]|nr:hypothetical protein Vi05172_g11638 [Venturia inaequalis]
MFSIHDPQLHPNGGLPYLFKNRQTLNEPESQAGKP